MWVEGEGDEREEGESLGSFRISSAREDDGGTTDNSRMRWSTSDLRRDRSEDPLFSLLGRSLGS